MDSGAGMRGWLKGALPKTKKMMMMMRCACIAPRSYCIRGRYRSGCFGCRCCRLADAANTMNRNILYNSMVNCFSRLTRWITCFILAQWRKSEKGTINKYVNKLGRKKHINVAIKFKQVSSINVVFLKGFFLGE